jgi:UDP-N-acetylglucosamine--N-acetylmuramyl-(pentapeptide) pyrophosphoryl-undecaprenol N-acetylglucosamine transferase
MKIIVSAGGTGGHIYPALSFIKENKEHNIIYLGTQSKLEERIFKDLNMKF